jgi:WD40 repeat protein
MDQIDFLFNVYRTAIVFSEAYRTGFQRGTIASLPMSGSPRSARPQFSSITTAAWSYHANVCAGIGNDYRVHFLSSAGVDQVSMRISRNQRATQLCWSTSNTLAIGWGDGSFSLWRDEAITDGEALRRSPITNAVWHPTLPVVVSGCRNSDLSLWNTDGKVERVIGHESELEIAVLAFRPSDEPLVFIGAKDGSILSFTHSEDPIANLGSVPQPIHLYCLIHRAINWFVLAVTM